MKVNPARTYLEIEKGRQGERDGGEAASESVNNEVKGTMKQYKCIAVFHLCQC